MIFTSTPVQLAIIQASPFCNIDCKYCYLPERGSTRRMSPEKLEEVYRFLFREPSLLSSRLQILWHSGEPLTVPLSFYDLALSLQQQLCPSEISVVNSLHTNGTLLSDEWVAFIKARNIMIGVSLDGSARFHDANRVTRSGLGTFEKVKEGITLLAKAGVPFHVTTVLNDRSLDHPTELWETYSELGVTRIHFLIEEVQGIHTLRTLPREALQSRLERFYAVINDCRSKVSTTVYIRELDDNQHKLTRGEALFKEIEQVPLGIISISVEGNLATFSPELLGTTSLEHGRFVFGNTSTSTLQELLQHPTFRSAYRSILKGYVQCEQVCEYFRFCGGGQPSIKLYENGSFESTETPSCQMRIKAPLNVLQGRTTLMHNNNDTLVDK